MNKDSGHEKQLFGENLLLRQQISGLQGLEKVVAALAHDLHNPILSIIGYCKHLRKGLKNLTVDDARIFEQIIKNAQLVEEITRSLREYATVGESPLKVVRFDIQEVFDSIRAVFSAELETRNVILVLPGKSVFVNADRTRIIRICNNIISNAIKYGESSLSRIEFKCKRDADFWIFSVYNDGKKIKPEDCERMFNLYTRHENSCNGIEGTGLGLPIVRKIAEKHGGSAWAKAGKKRGVTFYFTIPRVIPEL